MAAEKIDGEFDPQRCRAVTGSRQCTNKAPVGFEYCINHNSGERMRLRKLEDRQYLVTQWRAKIDRHANSPMIKSLREEIGIARMMLENTLNRCDDDNALELMSPKIMEMLSVLQKLIESCHRLEEKTQFLVDKNQIIVLAEQILNIIQQFVTDPNILTSIAEQIQSAIMTKSVIVDAKEAAHELAPIT
jgi:hypothetical protein